MIVATCTVQDQIPNTAATVADRLGIVAPGAFDVNAACAGFVYALNLASDSVRVGSARNVLVIGSEKLSDYVDWEDRSTCVIFADGAGAAVVSAAEDHGIGPVVWGSSGERADKIYLREGKYLYQEGQAVFRWTTTELYKVALEALERAGVEPSELTAFVPHQANLRIVESIARKLGRPRRSWRAISSPRATPLPPRSLSRSRAWSSAGNCRRGAPCSPWDSVRAWSTPHR